MLHISVAAFEAERADDFDNVATGLHPVQISQCSKLVSPVMGGERYWPECLVRQFLWRAGK